MSTSAENQQLVITAADRLRALYPDRSRIALEAAVRAALEGLPTDGIFARKVDGEVQVCAVIAAAPQQASRSR